MCWIMVKKPQNPVPFDFIDEAQKRNKDAIQNLINKRIEICAG